MYTHLFFVRNEVRNTVIRFIDSYRAKYDAYDSNDPNASMEANPDAHDYVRLETYICDKDKKEYISKFPTIEQLRANFASKDSAWYKYHDNWWFVEDGARGKQRILYDFIDEIIRDCLKDYNSSFARQRNDKKAFVMRRRRWSVAKYDTHSFTIHSKQWKVKSGFWNLIKPSNLRDSRSGNQMPDLIDYAVRIKQTSSGKYYMCMPQAPKPLNQSKEGLLVCDPGYRTFMTAIDFTNNKLIEIAETTSHIIRRKLQHLNLLRSKIHAKRKVRQGDAIVPTNEYLFNHRTRHNMKRAYTKASDKISNMIDDLHKAAAKYMCENYSTIVVPKLNFHDFKNMRGSMKSIAARVSHCRFVDTLVDKAKQYSDCKVIVVDEAYTSKTCSRCAHLHTGLGASKVFDCPSCGVSLDRDANAVYNILMKAICKKKSWKHLFDVTGAGATPFPESSLGCELVR